MKATVIPIQSGKDKVYLAEQTVIGSILFDSKLLPAVESIISADDFAHPQHSIIFCAFQELQTSGLTIDLVSTTENLHRTGKLDSIGGPGYLADLGENIGSASQAEYYARIVRESAVSRKYLEQTKKNYLEAEQAAAGAMRLHDVLSSHETGLFAISKEYYRYQNIHHIGDIAIEEIQRLEDISNKGRVDGISTGLIDIDRITSGLQPSELIYLAARPGVGKTALALNIANNCGVPVGFFSLEMSASEIAKRQLSLISGVDGYLLRTMRLTANDWGLISQAAAEMSDLKIYVDDKPSPTIQEIRSKSRQLVAKHGVKLIIIDYLQIMKVTTGRSREQEISNVSGQLKAMAKELSIPVLCLAQLNREVEKREGGKPKLSDLRESGSLEQDADMVIFLWPINKESMEVNFSIAKNRNGRTGINKLILNKSTLKFYDFEE